jgi:hemerythrin
MLEYEYPGYERHKEEHEKFKVQITQFLKEHNEGTLILSFPILVFLRDWLSSHVLDTDKQYGPYLKEKMGA